MSNGQGPRTSPGLSWTPDPEDPPAAGSGTGAEPPVVTVDDKKLTAAQIAELINSDEAGSIEVEIDGEKATLKDLRLRRALLTQKTQAVAEERKQIEADRARLAEDRKQLEADRARLQEEAKEAGPRTLKEVAAVLQEAAHPSAPKDPFRTREAALAYITERLSQDYTGAVAEVVEQMLAGREASAKALAELRAEFDAKLTKALKGQEDRELARQAQAERAAIVAAVPEYGTRTRFGQALTATVDRLMLSKQPDAEFLGGAVGIDMDGPTIALKVREGLRAESEKVAAALAEERRQREEKAATEFGAGGPRPRPLSEELKQELAQAAKDGDMEKVADIQRRIAGAKT